MRLQEIKQIIESNINDLKFESKAKNNDYYEISGYLKTIKAIDNLSQLKYFNDLYMELKHLEFIYFNKSSVDKMLVDVPTYNIFMKVVNNIISKTTAVWSALDLAVPDQDDNTLCVKLPDYKNLNKLPSFFKSLDTSLNQAIDNKNIKGTIEIQAFDSGSLWVIISVGTTAALKFLGSIITSASRISDLVFQNKKYILDLEKQKASQDVIDEINKLNLKRLNSYVEEEIKVINSEHSIQDIEYLGTLNYVIKEISHLILEGTQFHPGEKTPIEEQKCFPDYNHLKPQIEANQKLLQDSSEQSDSVDDPEEPTKKNTDSEE